MTRERDAAISQLGVAYLSSQELKAENHSLREENEKLKRHLAKFLGGDSQNLKWHGEDTARSQETSQSDGQTTTGHVEEATESEYATQQNRKQRSSTSKRDKSRTKISSQINEQLSKLNKQQEDDSLFSIDMPSLRPQSRNQSKNPMKSASEKKSNTGKQRAKKVVVEDIETSDDDSEGEVEAMTGGTKTRSEADQDQDLTFLSFIDVSSWAFFSHSAHG